MEDGLVELSWKVMGPPTGARKAVRGASFTLRISQAAVELSFDVIDASDPVMNDLYSKVIDEIQTVVWSYIQHTKMSSLYFVRRKQEEEGGKAANRITRPEKRRSA